MTFSDGVRSGCDLPSLRYEPSKEDAMDSISPERTYQFPTWNEEISVDCPQRVQLAGYLIGLAQAGVIGYSFAQSSGKGALAFDLRFTILDDSLETTVIDTFRNRFRGRDRTLGEFFEPRELHASYDAIRVKRTRREMEER